VKGEMKKNGVLWEERGVGWGFGVLRGQLKNTSEWGERLRKKSIAFSRRARDHFSRKITGRRPVDRKDLSHHTISEENDRY